MLPGHNISMAEYNHQHGFIKGLTLGQIDLMSDTTRKRFFRKALAKYTTQELLIALMEKDVNLSDEQMGLLKEDDAK
jgi:hypothetical protein